MDRTIVASGGWCAPGTTIFDLGFDVWADPLEPERWPAGLTSEDLDWIAATLHAVEIDLPDRRWYDLPDIMIRRGGIRFPTMGAP